MDRKERQKNTELKEPPREALVNSVPNMRTLHYTLQASRIQFSDIKLRRVNLGRGYPLD